jgi:hypothetical protein
MSKQTQRQPSSSSHSSYNNGARYRKFVLLFSRSTSTQEEGKSQLDNNNEHIGTRIVRSSHPFEAKERLNRQGSTWNMEVALGPYDHSTTELAAQISSSGEDFWKRVWACVQFSDKDTRFVNKREGVIARAISDYFLSSSSSSFSSSPVSRSS